MPKSQSNAPRANSRVSTLAALAQAGVNRVSFGVQSFIDAKLTKAGVCTRAPMFWTIFAESEPPVLPISSSI